MVDAVGTTRYSYHAAGLLATEDGPWADDTVSYSYQYRSRASLSLAQPGGSAWSQSYEYDAARRLQTLTSPAGTFGYGFDPVRHALVNKISLPNSAYITNTFDLVARLTGTYLKNSANSVLDAHEYAYSVAGQRTRQTRTYGDFVDYGYDNAGQLLSALGKEANGTTQRLNEQLRYAYDAAGNLNWRTNNALVQQFSVNNLNELATNSRTGTLTVAGTTTGPATNVTVNGFEADRYADATFARAGFTPADGENAYTAVARDSYGRVDTNSIVAYLPATLSFAYDADGNLTNDGRRVFGYDDENQIASMVSGTEWRSEFVYDGERRRRIQRDYAWSGASWVLTNEVHLVYDRKVILQQRGGNNLPVLTLTRGLDLSGALQGAGGIGGLLAMSDSSLFALGPSRATHAYYHSDAGGNVTCLLNKNQFPVATAIYDPYGSFLSLGGPSASVNPFWYSSKPLHRLSGNYDFLYRWYSFEWQRWLSRDPLGEVGGCNLLQFVFNQPTALVDSDGRVVPLLLAAAMLIFTPNIAGEHTPPAPVYALPPPSYPPGTMFWQADHNSIGTGGFLRALGAADLEGTALAEAEAEIPANLMACALPFCKLPCSAAAKSVAHSHHPLPKFLGGDASQLLSKLDPKIHTEFHQILRQNLKDGGIPLNVGGKGGSAADWAQYMQFNPGAQRTAFDSVLNASRAIDTKYGTQITQDVWRNVMPGNFTPYP